MDDNEKTEELRRLVREAVDIVSALADVVDDMPTCIEDLVGNEMTQRIGRWWKDMKTAGFV